MAFVKALQLLNYFQSSTSEAKGLVLSSPVSNIMEFLYKRIGYTANQVKVVRIVSVIQRVRIQMRHYKRIVNEKLSTLNVHDI